MPGGPRGGRRPARRALAAALAAVAMATAWPALARGAPPASGTTRAAPGGAPAPGDTPGGTGGTGGTPGARAPGDTRGGTGAAGAASADGGGDGAAVALWIGGEAVVLAAGTAGLQWWRQRRSRRHPGGTPGSAPAPCAACAAGRPCTRPAAAGACPPGPVRIRL